MAEALWRGEGTHREPPPGGEPIGPLGRSEAGATRTPGYLTCRPEATGGFVLEMEPADVAAQALASLGSVPSMIPGKLNRIAGFLMQRLLSRRAAVLAVKRASPSLGV